MLRGVFEFVEGKQMRKIMCSCSMMSFDDQNRKCHPERSARSAAKHLTFERGWATASRKRETKALVPDMREASTPGSPPDCQWWGMSAMISSPLRKTLNAAKGDNV
jgi:hypothetical protein